MKKITAFLYWFGTASPIAWVLGNIFRRKTYDSLGSVYLPRNTTPRISSSILFNLYERPERVAVRQWLPPNFDCIEVGASIGIVSREILGKLNPDKKLFALEALPELCSLAIKNVDASGKNENFSITPKAISYHSSSVSFITDCDHIAGRAAGSSGPQSLSVPGITLSEFVNSKTREGFSLVMDIEGMEFEVLAKDHTIFDRCQCLVVELHGNSPEKERFNQSVIKMGLQLVQSKHNVHVFRRLS
jgi:FkbM family methyltransferase